MADRDKVAELLRVAHVGSEYGLLIRGFVDQAEALTTTNEKLENAHMQAEFFEGIRRLILGKVASLYAESFTDKEIDMMIRFHSSRVAEKERELGPKFQAGIIKHLDDNMYDIVHIALRIISDTDA